MESNSNNSGYQVAFYCHTCARSFLSDSPKCTQCGGEFVECIGEDNLGLMFGIGVGFDMESGTGGDTDSEDVDMNTDTDTSSTSGSDTEEDEEADDEDADDTEGDQNTPSLQDILSRHFSSHLHHLHQLGIPVSALSAHMAAVTGTIPNIHIVYQDTPLSLLHLLLHSLQSGPMAGDPRDYVNDPVRFAQLLDQLFQSHQGTTLPAMSPEEITKLTRKSGDCNDTCPVCIEAMCGGVVLVETGCGHVFHESCIVPWLERTASCPVCRADLTSTVKRE